MQKLLSGEVRFDGFSDKWEEVRIDKLFDFKKGQELSKEKLEKNGIFECILYVISSKLIQLFFYLVNP